MGSSLIAICDEFGPGMTTVIFRDTMSADFIDDAFYGCGDATIPANEGCGEGTGRASGCGNWSGRGVGEHRIDMGIGFYEINKI